ncbi:MAG: sigma-70 family RNA polymerase sigma factor [Pirellulales bacterium]|nr:sigma-70 family RNA polymerase sigma factor [Pirellulales bacterium]
MAVNDDFQLIDEALAGDTSAFGHLVTKYQDRLYNTLVRVVGCVDEARDVCQEAFIKAYVKLSLFQRESAFYTWLYRIALNLAITKQRKKRPTHSIDANRELLGEEPLAREGAPADRLEQQERACQVQAALANLDKDFRTVIVLREIEGHDYETIAAMLELPLGTVRSRLHRARMELKEQLREVIQEGA